MDFESVQEAAERMGVTVRTIQKWAAAGKISGARKIGRGWVIPKDAIVSSVAQEDTPAQTEAVNEAAEAETVSSRPFRMPMPLINSSFPVGRCMEYINAIPDKDDLRIALGEYFYFSGQAERAAEAVEEYLDSKDASLRYSASLICTFANLSLGRIHLARFAQDRLREQLYASLQADAPPHLHAIGIFTATTASVLLHLPVPETPPLENYLRYLPDGLRLYSCYVLAHKAYLEQNYERSLAIAETGLAMCPEIYPIAAIYVHLVAVMDLMSLKRTEEAKQRLMGAWELAQPDDLIEPFGEHHGLLQGMIEVFFKKDHPAFFDRIINITYSFSAGWRKVHNPDTNEDVADNLTTTEFTIAMLYNRGWLTKEIADHMRTSEHTVKNQLRSAFMKLGINDRKDLGKYMLK